MKTVVTATTVRGGYRYTAHTSDGDVVIRKASRKRFTHAHLTRCLRPWILTSSPDFMPPHHVETFDVDWSEVD